MKSLAVVFVAATIGLTPNADAAQSGHAFHLSLCRSVSGLVVTIAQKRDEGLSLDRANAILDSVGGETDHATLREIVAWVYASELSADRLSKIAYDKCMAGNNELESFDLNRTNNGPIEVIPNTTPRHHHHRPSDNGPVEASPSAAAKPDPDGALWEPTVEPSSFDAPP